ncbi:hypothetical protein SAMN05216525_12968 [Bradyrhizobium sp. Gha]|nr:hypothetical protein SAMN05216525_12968 [Bradyrhizobium sp. Gha]
MTQDVGVMILAREPLGSSRTNRRTASSGPCSEIMGGMPAFDAIAVGACNGRSGVVVKSGGCLRFTRKHQANGSASHNPLIHEQCAAHRRSWWRGTRSALMQR